MEIKSVRKCNKIIFRNDPFPIGTVLKRSEKSKYLWEVEVLFDNSKEIMLVHDSTLMDLIEKRDRKDNYGAWVVFSKNSDFTGLKIKIKSTSYKDIVADGKKRIYEMELYSMRIKKELLQIIQYDILSKDEDELRVINDRLQAIQSDEHFCYGEYGKIANTYWIERAFQEKNENFYKIPSELKILYLCEKAMKRHNEILSKNNRWRSNYNEILKRSVFDIELVSYFAEHFANGPLRNIEKSLSKKIPEYIVYQVKIRWALEKAGCSEFEINSVMYRQYEKIVEVLTSTEVKNFNCDTAEFIEDTFNNVKWDTNVNVGLIDKDGKIGLVNENQEIILSPEFNSITLLTDIDPDFSPTYFGPLKIATFTSIIVKVEAEYGADILIVNKEGEFETQKGFSDAYYMEYRLIAAKKDGKWGVLMAEGELLIPYEYDAIEKVSMVNREVYIQIKRNGLKGLYSERSKLHIPCSYSKITYHSDVYDEDYNVGIIVHKNNKIGIIHEMREAKIPVIYDEYQFKDGYYIMRQGDLYEFYDINCLKLYEYKFDSVSITYEHYHASVSDRLYGEWSTYRFSKNIIKVKLNEEEYFFDMKNKSFSKAK